MSSHSLLLVLLVLACLQSFMAESGGQPSPCCFNYQTSKIPVKIVTKYIKTDRQCTKPGVIFTLKDGHHVCADPTGDWVQKHMKTIDQRLFTSLVASND